MGLQFFNSQDGINIQKSIDPNELAIKQLIHDIKSPLSTLNLCMSHLIQIIPKDDKNKEILDIVKISVERIEALINTSIETTKNTNKLSNFLNKLSGLIKEYQFKVSTQFSFDNHTQNQEIKFNFNSNELINVLHNLYNNSLNAQANHIHTLIFINNNSLCIHITDNGAGMDNEILYKIGHVGSSYCKSVKGQGLGLSHAKEKVLSWEGHLSIESLEKRGTKVIIQIPL